MSLYEKVKLMFVASLQYFRGDGSFSNNEQNSWNPMLSINEVIRNRTTLSKQMEKSTKQGRNAGCFLLWILHDSRTTCVNETIMVLMPMNMLKWHSDWRPQWLTVNVGGFPVVALNIQYPDENRIHRPPKFSWLNETGTKWKNERINDRTKPKSWTSSTTGIVKIQGTNGPN